jgi:hypothetical protein
VTAIACAFIFGGLDQYLGSVWPSTHLGFWTADVSQMSAPWLAVPFLAGWRQAHAREASIAGTTVTFAALLGYFALTLSPLEGVGADQIHLLSFVASQLHVIIPALVTGPVWGWLGWRWRTARSLPSAALLAAGFCLEPLARVVIADRFRYDAVGATELGIGIALLIVSVVGVRRRAGHGPAPGGR